MGLAGVLSVFVVKRHEKPWEVVDSKAVEPVPLFDEDDDIDVIYVHETRVARTFVFDVRKDKDLENSLQFAQQQFLEEIQRKGYNTFWSEGWQLTLLRKAKRHRVEIEYIGQPACLTGKPVQSHPPPPFLAVLAELRLASAV
ncbi:hypothetical protein F5148DRAFT_794832 [Russula earlei]|uniref:Uncharacterized protein n=1 Tax=Russula earlei TaxID=71964 RepID=A0ACC0UMY3_9AGAM|nr:hypothetical protein F5148DRAFT_794832 [Russula earlei]